jgi:hypothetical protein
LNQWSAGTCLVSGRKIRSPARQPLTACSSTIVQSPARGSVDVRANVGVFGDPCRVTAPSIASRPVPY